MSRADIVKKQLQEQNHSADLEMTAVLEKLPNITEPELREHIRRFILKKYLLDMGCEEENIRRLSEMSIERVLELNQRELNTADLGLGCGGVSSVLNKIILMLMAIQRQLGVTMDPTKTPEITTIPVLSEKIYELLKSSGRAA